MRFSSDYSRTSTSTQIQLHFPTGIPTFRTGNGLWQSHDVTKLATPGGFASNPALVWQFYQERRRSYVCSTPVLSRSFLFSLGFFPSVLSASPNPAHYALMLSIPSYLQAVAPNCTWYTVITQNVDGLRVHIEKSCLVIHHSRTPPYHHTHQTFLRCMGGC